MTSFVPNWATNLTTINVKDYGAQGIGAGHDDTSAIQAAMDAAWGPVNNPNGKNASGGVTGPRLNKPLYFPAGDYNVSGITPKSIVSIADNGSGYIRVEVADTSDLKVGWIVSISGVTTTLYAGLGVDGPLQYVNLPRGIKAIPDSTHFDLQLTLMGTDTATFGSNWNGAFDSGTGTVQTACLHMRAVDCPVVFGDGMDTTRIRAGDGNAVISVNGMANGIFRDMSFVAVTGAYCVFDYNWTDKSADLSQTQNSQNMQFNNCAFGGQSGVPILMAVGIGGQQTDTSTWINCSFNGNGGGAGSGLVLGNQNCIGHSIWGGNYQGFANYSVDSGSGNFLSIASATFTNNPTSTSIRLSNVNDSTCVSGCSSEDLHFIECHAGLGLAIDGCEHRGPAGGNFLFYEGSGDFTAASGHCTISGCWSKNGIIGSSSNGYISIVSSWFGVGIKTALASFNGAGGRLLACDVGPQTFANLPTPSAQLTNVRMRCSDSPIAPVDGMASFTGVIGPSSAALAVSGVTGQIAVGQVVSGAGVSANTYIVSGSGPSWVVNNSQSVSSEAMFSSGNKGAIITAGGGSNEVMLKCDGSNWRID